MWETSDIIKFLSDMPSGLNKSIVRDLQTLEELRKLPQLYLCDVNKNEQCTKTGCYINGGDCRHTTHKEFEITHDNG